MPGHKTISFTLDAHSIGNAIAELQAYLADFTDKVNRLRKMVAERITWTAEQGFQTAMVSDVIDGDEPVNDVTVTVTHDETVSVVIASGTQAVFIEFGAGVWHNGPAGSSPHPWGAEKGYTIGGYGKGKGKYDVWRYEGGATFGTPAAMPMYRGWEEARQALDEMVREVFGA